MHSNEYYSLSKPKIRNFNVLMCSCNGTNFRNKRRSQTDLMNSTDIENMMAKNISRPTVIGSLIDQTNQTNQKQRNSCVKVSVLYDRTIKGPNINKIMYFKDISKPSTSKTKVIKGIHNHVSFSSKENIPIIKGIKGARAKMHAIYIDSLKPQKNSVNTVFQTRNASHDFDFSISENRKGTAMPFTSIYNRPEYLTNSHSFVVKDGKIPKYISKICVRCPAPKMLA
jgi:hypothetical protein